MDIIHRILTAVFDVVLAPLEWMGDLVALVLASGVFGVLALLVFKQISWQAGIRSTKDKIKGHMIGIRIYQDDLGIVLSSVAKVVLRNFQYLGLNFGPILPLFVPFVLIAAQFVVRYAFQPLPVLDAAKVHSMLPGRGNMLEIRFKQDRRADMGALDVKLPPFLVQLSPLARNVGDGLAVLEFAAVAPGDADIEFHLGAEVVGSKRVVAGDECPRSLQPGRVSGFFESWLWPAEPRLPIACPLASVSFLYPRTSLGPLPSGEGGVLLTFFLASIVFGVVALKPLNIQI
jgi:hypothetical protein